MAEIDPVLIALRQWESDTEAPASAPEGNAFIDGYRAGEAAGHLAGLEEATKLVCPEMCGHDIPVKKYVDSDNLYHYDYVGNTFKCPASPIHAEIAERWKV